MNIAQIIKDFDEKDLISHIVLIGEKGSIRNIEIGKKEIDWVLEQ